MGREGGQSRKGEKGGADQERRWVVGRKGEEGEEWGWRKGKGR